MTSASILSVRSFQQQHPNSHFKFQRNNTIESSIVLGIPATIQTQRIKMVHDLLKKYPLLPLPSNDLNSQTGYTSIKEFSLFPQQSSVSLDEIFNEWLQLSNPAKN